VEMDLEEDLDLIAFFHYCSRIFGAIVKDQLLFLFIFEFLYINYTPLINGINVAIGVPRDPSFC
jgi:hypothetical protein